RATPGPSREGPRTNPDQAPCRSVRECSPSWPRESPRTNPIGFVWRPGTDHRPPPASPHARLPERTAHGPNDGAGAPSPPGTGAGGGAPRPAPAAAQPPVGVAAPPAPRDPTPPGAAPDPRPPLWGHEPNEPNTSFDRPCSRSARLAGPSRRGGSGGLGQVLAG